MTKMDDRLEEILGIRETDGSLDEQLDSLDDEGAKQSFELVEYKEVDSKIEDAPVNQDALDDYKYSRKILYGLIERGTAALESALIVAKESENPRAYETASNIMRNVSDMTKDLINLQKALNPPKTGSIKADTINVQNNNNTYVQKEPENPNNEIFGILDELDDEDGSQG